MLLRVLILLVWGTSLFANHNNYVDSTPFKACSAHLHAAGNPNISIRLVGSGLTNPLPLMMQMKRAHNDEIYLGVSTFPFGMARQTNIPIPGGGSLQVYAWPEGPVFGIEEPIAALIQSLLAQLVTYQPGSQTVAIAADPTEFHERTIHHWAAFISTAKANLPLWMKVKEESETRTLVDNLLDYTSSVQLLARIRQEKLHPDLHEMVKLIRAMAILALDELDAKRPGFIDWTEYVRRTFKMRNPQQAFPRAAAHIAAVREIYMAENIAKLVDSQIEHPRPFVFIVANSSILFLSRLLTENFVLTSSVTIQIDENLTTGQFVPVDFMLPNTHGRGGPR